MSRSSSHARTGGGNRGDAGAALVRQICHLDKGDTLAVADQLPNLTVPARLAWGARDPWLDSGYGYRMAHETGAHLDRVDEGKHFVPEDQAQRVAQAVTDLLEELARNWQGVGPDMPAAASGKRL